MAIAKNIEIIELSNIYVQKHPCGLQQQKWQTNTGDSIHLLYVSKICKFSSSTIKIRDLKMRTIIQGLHEMHLKNSSNVNTN